MNATKRKFNALLNGIGNKSTTSLSSKEVNNGNTDTDFPSTPDNLTKKRRIIPTPTPRSTHPLLQRSPASNMHKKSASEAVPSEPKYAPWDRSAFLARLSSFSNLTDWTPKPPRVNEVEWAKRGWVCQKSERVRCCLCNVEILVKLNKKTVDGKEEPVYVAQNIEDALVEKYVCLIVESHSGDCLWRKRGCDEMIFKLPVVSAPLAMRGVRERYDELCLRKDTLPYEFNIKLPSGFDLKAILSYLPKDFFSNSPLASTDTSLNTTALTLALFGWQGHAHPRLGNQLGSISCAACFRVLGLWLFKSKAVSVSGEETEGPIVDCLNVVKEHRDYCPWSNPASQNGHGRNSTSMLAGWEVVQRVLKNEFYLKHAGENGRGKEVEVSIRPTTAGSAESFRGGDEDVELSKERDAKDKERWAKLRRVKSLFDTKGKKLHRTASAKSKVG